jgi:hypothetical protein
MPQHIPVTFYGPWSLLVVRQDATVQRRLTISRSDNSDGSFPATLGLAIPEIRGNKWTVDLPVPLSGFEFGDVPIQRTVNVTQSDGLVVTLSSDVLKPINRPVNDPEFRPGAVTAVPSDLLVFLKYLDPVANPPGPTNPFDFTIPREWLSPGKEPYPSAPSPSRSPRNTYGRGS